MSHLYLSQLILVLLVYFDKSSSYDLKAFDDTILFKINWPGKTGADLLVKL